jgi:hypothetical protein
VSLSHGQCIKKQRKTCSQHKRAKKGESATQWRAKYLSFRNHARITVAPQELQLLFGRHFFFCQTLLLLLRQLQLLLQLFTKAFSCLCALSSTVSHVCCEHNLHTVTFRTCITSKKNNSSGKNVWQ